MAEVTTTEIWDEVESQMFAVLGMVNAKGKARTAGVVYLVDDGKLYVGTARDEWKTRHIASNPNVSVTIPVAKRIPFMPWIRIPSATITFAGRARVQSIGDVSSSISTQLAKDLTDQQGELPPSVIIEITPVADFVTYGVGVSLSQMRDTGLARGRAPVAA